MGADLRHCLVALSPEGGRFRRLFEHRYEGSGDLAGHSVGNLILTALAESEGCWSRAVAAAGTLLGAVGRVFPVSLDPARLEAETGCGERISGNRRSAPPLRRSGACGSIRKRRDRRPA